MRLPPTFWASSAPFPAPSICASTSSSICRKIQVNVDRTKALESGYSQLDVANSLLISLSGSFQTQPSYWLDPKNGVTYSLVAQTPQYDVSSLSDLDNIPITSDGERRPEILGDVVSTSRRAEMAVVSHYNIAARHRHFRQRAGSRSGRRRDRHQSHRR